MAHRHWPEPNSAKKETGHISGIDRTHLESAQRIAEIGSWELDLITHELRWSRETFRIFEIDPLDSPASYDAFLALLHPEDREMLDAVFDEAVASRTPYDCVHRLWMPDGRWKWLRERGEALYSGEGTPLRAVGTVQDITAQKEAESALAASESRYRALVEALADGVIAEDDDGVIVVFNSAAEGLLGLRHEEAVGRRWADIAHPSTRVIASLRPHRAPDGSEIEGNGPRSVAYSPPGCGQRYLEVRTFIGCADASSFRTTIVRDRTPEHDAAVMQTFGAAQRAEVKHMASLGALAAGVAHEFNNTLNAVLGQSELARIEAREGALPESRFDAIRQSVARGARIVDEILGYSKGGGSQFSAINLADVVGEAACLARSALPARIDLDVAIEDPDVWVLGSEPLIHQVVGNLCQNSRQALGRRRGAIRVSLGSIRSRSEVDGPASPADLAWLAVEDTGPGIPEAVIDRVFDPFFSTRRGEGGSGLGLAVVQGIVVSHGGSVHAENTPCGGARIVITLPTMPRVDRAERTSRAAQVRPVISGVRAAAVDDSGATLDALVEALRLAGAHVDGYRDPLEMLKRLSMAPDSLDVLITDVRMPVIDGVELAKRARDVNPALRVIMVTGYASPELRAEARRAGVTAVLDKPVDPSELIAAVAQVTETGAMHTAPERPLTTT